MKKKDPLAILDDEINEEVLSQMPEWFRKLKAEHGKKKSQSLA